MMAQSEHGSHRAPAHSLQQIARMLDARAPELCRQLLSGGRQQGREWVARDFAGGAGTELSVCIAGEKQGVWAQFNTSPLLTGDMLDLVTLAVCGGNKAEAVRWAKAYLGLDGADKSALQRTRQSVPVARRGKSAEKIDAASREKAYATLQSCEAFGGSLAEQYLRGRGIDFSGLTGRLRVLRFHPGLDYWMAGDKPKLIGAWPAMVAPVYDFKGAFRAIHRTWLQPRADGSVGKAPVDNPKKVQGRMSGGFVPLWRGTRVDPVTGEVKPGLPLRDAPPGQVVDITEGIEDAASLVMHCEDARVYAGISISNMAAIQWPEQVEVVNFWRDNDAAGSTADKAAAGVVLAWQRQGKRVKICRAPPEHKDINAWLMAALREKRA